MESSRSTGIAPAAAAQGRVGWRRALPGSLARRAARGDEAAFAEIFAAHHQEIFRYCQSILRNQADAEDALQATMAAALRALPGEERDIAIRPWLFKVAHNESISILRGRKRETVSDEVPEQLTVSGEVEYEQKERLRQLVADLEQLPDRQRSALVMRELSDLSYAEIGAALGCSEGAGRQTVYEARTALATLAEGRDMSCDEAREAISARDKRKLRGRKLKAHIDSCEDCQDFQLAIEQRRNDFAMLFPALPAVAAAGVLTGVIGGTAATGGGAAAASAGGASVGATGAGLGIGGAAAGGGVAVKGASMLAALAIAAGAGEATGVVDLPTPSGGGQESSQGSAPSPPAVTSEPGAAGKPGSEQAKDSRTRGIEASGAKGANGKAKGKGKSTGNGKPDNPGASGKGNGAASTGANAPSGSTGSSNAGGNSNGAGNSAGSNAGGNAGGNSSTAPGQTGSPGQSGSAPGQSGSSPGNSGSAPGKSGTAPGQTGGSTSGPGNSGSAPGQSGAAPPGKSGSAGGSGGAGQSGSAPSTSTQNPGGSGGSSGAPGNSGSAPGQSGSGPGKSKG